MYFEILDAITHAETFATGTAIREIVRLRIRRAEIHWYEATGIGKKEFKIKRFLEDA